MITEQGFTDSAARIGCTVAAIKAVAEVESGAPVILFEPHIFWKRLKAHGVNPASIAGAADILYPTWKPGAYGPSSKQHGRLERAAAIHRDAALESASWGKFQILGMNWRSCGVESLQAFINAMYQSEDEHLKLFTGYIIRTGLDDELRELDWKGFARAYNGPLYWKNQYDVKLKKAYVKFTG